MGISKKTHPRVIAGNWSGPRKRSLSMRSGPAQPPNEGRQRLDFSTLIALTYFKPQQPPLKSLTSSLRHAGALRSVRVELPSRYRQTSSGRLSVDLKGRMVPRETHQSIHRILSLLCPCGSFSVHTGLQAFRNKCDIILFFLAAPYHIRVMTREDHLLAQNELAK